MPENPTENTDDHAAQRAQAECAYWLSKTPAQRLFAVEFLRQIVYDYDPEIDRIQKVFEVVDMKDLE